MSSVVVGGILLYRKSGFQEDLSSVVLAMVLLFIWLEILCFFVCFAFKEFSYRVPCTALRGGKANPMRHEHPHPLLGEGRQEEGRKNYVYSFVLT